MATTKLTLSVDRELIHDAKRLADRQGSSLSAMFSRFLRVVLGNEVRAHSAGPLTRKATGLVKLPPRKPDHQLLESALGLKYRFRK